VATVADTIEGKAKVLKRRFYPVVTATIDDIVYPSFPKESFRDPIEIQRATDEQEIIGILAKRSPSSAPRPDEIPNSFLRAMGNPLARALSNLTNASFSIGYYPKAFKNARTIVIRKPGKETY
jgi:hypothetical protein